MNPELGIRLILTLHVTLRQGCTTFLLLPGALPLLYELRPPVSFQDTVIFALLLFCFRTQSQACFHTSVSH